MFRFDLINAFIRKFGYKNYLEIGVNFGDCIRNVIAERKDGVDPEVAKCPGGVNYPMPSDEFFASLTPGEKNYDIVFIDGLHEHRQVVRDVLNSLSQLAEGGTILLHDCNPPTAYHASEHNNGGDWNGTVYKAILELRRTHPELDICVVDTDWGVGVVRRGLGRPINAELAEAASRDFAVFDANRAELLDLMPVGEFQAWLDGLL